MLNIKEKSKLNKAYSVYKKKEITKKNLLSKFMSTMPEIILRTTKLEDESVTKKMVNLLFNQK